MAADVHWLNSLSIKYRATVWMIYMPKLSLLLPKYQPVHTVARGRREVVYSFVRVVSVYNIAASYAKSQMHQCTKVHVKCGRGVDVHTINKQGI